MAKVSILMPVYNVERFVERAVRSALEQTFDDLEVVIVNDATPDGSMEIVRRVVAEYPHRVVKIVDHPVNMGLAVARQTGIDNATGEYVTHLDSDDWMGLEMAERMYAAAKKDNADIVVCDTWSEYRDHSVYKAKKCVPPTGRELAHKLIRDEVTCGQCDKMTRRSLWTDNGIKMVPGINQNEDLVSNFKLSFCAARVSYLPEAFHHFVKYNDGSLTARFTKRVNTDPIRAIEEIEEFLNSHGAGDEFVYDLILKKLTVRKMMMQNTRGEEQRGMAALWSEIPRRYIFKHPVMKASSKAALFLASFELYWTANAIWGAARVITKLKRTLRR